jgi:hypothetical protein
LLLKNPWRSLFGGSWTLANNANRWIRVSLQPTSVVAPAKRIIAPGIFFFFFDAQRRRPPEARSNGLFLFLSLSFFNAYLKRALISLRQKTHSNGIYNAALPGKSCGCIFFLSLLLPFQRIPYYLATLTGSFCNNLIWPYFSLAR